MNSFFSTDFFLSHVSFFVDSLNLYWTTHEHCKRKDTYQNLDLQIEAFHNKANQLPTSEICYSQVSRTICSASISSEWM